MNRLRRHATIDGQQVILDTPAHCLAHWAECYTIINGQRHSAHQIPTHALKRQLAFETNGHQYKIGEIIE